MFSSLLITTKLKELCSNYPSTMFLTNAKKKLVLTPILPEKLFSPSSVYPGRLAIFGQLSNV